MNKRSVKLKKLAIRHRGRTIMARKKHHESQHDDDTELAIDDEPEAGWTEDFGKCSG